MWALKELSILLSDDISLINQLLPKQHGSPIYRLKELLFNDDIESEEIAIKKIYGKLNSEAFRKLEARLEEIFVKVLLLKTVPFESSNSRINLGYDYLRYSVASTLLSDLKSYDLSVFLAEKNLKRSLKNEMTDNILLLVKSLLLHYSSREVNKDKYEKYISIQDKYLYTQEWEIKSFRWLSQLQLYQMQYTSSPDEPLIEIARNYTILLNSIHDIKTHQFLLNRHKINILYHEFIHDFASILILSDEFINRIKPAFRSSSMVLSINIRKLFAMIQLGRNDAAIECGQTILKISSIESFGWFLGGYYTLKAYLYNKNYRESAFLISKIYENPKFKRLSSTLNEAFNATLGCIHLLKSVYHPADTQFKTSLPEFKLYKFLNTIPTFSKDKRGLNVTILLMHIGFLLLRKDYNGIIDRVDSLKHYAYRHLRRDDTFRSNCMIKMVIQMTKADFHPIRTARYTEDLLAKLKEVNLAGSGKNIETEIIPYEVLWDIMMKTCETNFYSKRTKGIA